MDAYQRAVQTNAQVVTLIRKHRVEPNQATLLEIFQLLRGITDQEIENFIDGHHLEQDLHEDMRQDSFLKLVEVIDTYATYDPDRCPVFMTFWRTCLHNHLYNLYLLKVREAGLTEEPAASGISFPGDRMLLDEMYLRYIQEFSTFPIATTILRLRIFIDPDLAKSQGEVAGLLGKTQGYVSRWETWLRKKIRTDYDT